MALPARADTTWTSIVAAAAETQMNGVVDIYDPANPINVPYDPATDTGGYTVPSVILSQIKARGVFVQRPQEFSSTIDWTVKRLARIQIPRSYSATPILRGYVIRFTDGGDDLSLPAWSFEVLSAANGSLAAVRTIECISSLAVVPAVA
jgi:hypothetical protein